MPDYEIVFIQVNADYTTVVAVMDAETEKGKLFYGVAHKSPKDKFDYRIGIELAFSRAMIKLHQSRIERFVE